MKCSALEAGSLIWYYTGSPSTTVGQVLGLSFQAPRTPRTPSETLSPESVQPEAEEEEDPEMAAQNRAQARLRAAQAAEVRNLSILGMSIVPLVTNFRYSLELSPLAAPPHHHSHGELLPARCSQPGHCWVIARR